MTREESPRRVRSQDSEPDGVQHSPAPSGRLLLASESARFDVSVDDLKPRRARRKGLKQAVHMVEEQRNLFGGETKLTIWRPRE